MYLQKPRTTLQKSAVFRDERARMGLPVFGPASASSAVKEARTDVKKEPSESSCYSTWAIRPLPMFAKLVLLACLSLAVFACRTPHRCDTRASSRGLSPTTTTLCRRQASVSGTRARTTSRPQHEEQCINILSRSSIKVRRRSSSGHAGDKCQQRDQRYDQLCSTWAPLK